MRSTLDCIPCFLRQALEVARITTSDADVQQRIMKEVLKMTAQMDLSITPPAMGQRVHQLIQALTETSDPYKKVKQRFNKLALQWLPDLQARVQASVDSFEAAVKLAIAGNIIDFGVDGDLDLSKVEKTIDTALHQSIDTDLLKQLEQEIEKANSILFLGDNAGEIVFDRLLIDLIRLDRIVYVVKGSPIINDATMEDAKQAGLTDLVRVIDNGTNAPGTVLELCSTAFRSEFDSADLIIAKGQGNFETLNEVSANLFFLFQAKCAVVARHINKPTGSFMLCRSECFDCVNECES